MATRVVYYNQAEYEIQHPMNKSHIIDSCNRTHPHHPPPLTPVIDLPINTNNGIERQNESLMEDQNSNSLSGMLTILIEEFFPDKYRR